MNPNEPSTPNGKIPRRTGSGRRIDDFSSVPDRFLNASSSPRKQPDLIVPDVIKEEIVKPSESLHMLTAQERADAFLLTDELPNMKLEDEDSGLAPSDASDTEQPEVLDSEVKDALSSLSIDEPEISSRPPRRNLEPQKYKKEKKQKGPKKSKKKRIILIIVLILIVILGVAGFLGVKAFLAYSKVTNGGSLLSLVTPGTPLKTDSQGRTNILLFGTSQDDSAHQNAAGGGGLWLTDSIQLMSIDQTNKTVKMVAIPRDLWVAVSNCDVGDYSKINAVYECASGLINDGSAPSNYSTLDKEGATALMSAVEAVTNIQPQYYIHGDYSVLKQAVDAVGGVSVNIVGDGADGIYDTNFDWDCPNGAYTCKNVYYPKDGTYTLNGTQALFLARARADSGEYSYKDFGLAKGDFDRQANQQKIITALFGKVKTAQVLANPLALNGLIDAFGNNISTNLQAGEIKTLLTFAKKLPTSSITSVSLVTTGSEVVTTSEESGQSVVIPTSGVYDFSSITDYLAKELSTNPAVAEGATIAVYNASSTAGAAAAEQTKLEASGLTVDTTGDADSADAGSGSYTLYNESGTTKPKTLAALQTSLGVKATTAALPSDITTSNNFVIVINQ